MGSADDESQIQAIESILPHRPPFLFVSRIISVDPGKSAVTEYDVPEDLPFFKGHFPGEPILPGVIILEILAQSGALALLVNEEERGKIAYLAGIESARFRKPVRPGETIRAETQIGVVRRRIGRAFGRAAGRAFVAGEEVANGTVIFAVPEEPAPAT